MFFFSCFMLLELLGQLYTVSDWEIILHTTCVKLQVSITKLSMSRKVIGF